MKKIKSLMYSSLLLAFLYLPSQIQAQNQTKLQAEVSIKDAWVRATVPEQKVTGAFMQIEVTQARRLIDVRSSVAQSVELHEMKMDGDVMKMRKVNGLDLIPGTALLLKPGSYHIMLMGLKAQVKAGDSVPLTLVLETPDKKTETVEIKALAKALNQSAHH